RRRAPPCRRAFQPSQAPPPPRSGRPAARAASAGDERARMYPCRRLTLCPHGVSNETAAAALGTDSGLEEAAPGTLVRRAREGSGIPSVRPLLLGGRRPTRAPVRLRPTPSAPQTLARQWRVRPACEPAGGVAVVRGAGEAPQPR